MLARNTNTEKKVVAIRQLITVHLIEMSVLY